jgi:hypothetical protein
MLRCMGVMLQCMGVKVEHSSYVFGDNLGVIQNMTIKDSLLKKKHLAISYHKTREATAAIPLGSLGTRNYTDCLTEALTEKIFGGLTNGCMSR